MFFSLCEKFIFIYYIIHLFFSHAIATCIEKTLAKNNLTFDFLKIYGTFLKKSAPFFVLTFEFFCLYGLNIYSFQSKNILVCFFCCLKMNAVYLEVRILSKIISDNL